MVSAHIDPVCAFHGLRRSEHRCLYCCLCFTTLTPDECWRDADGQQWDVCQPCGEMEALSLAVSVVPARTDQETT